MNRLVVVLAVLVVLVALGAVAGALIWKFHGGQPGGALATKAGWCRRI